MKHIVLSVYLTAAALLMFGCQSKELTRAKAKAIIEALDEFKAPNAGLVKVTDEEKKKGADLKLWKTGYNVFARYLYVDLTPYGKKYFANSEQSLSGTYLQPATPLRPHVVEITGITDAPMASNGSAQQVSFTWNYDFSTLDPSVQSLFQNHPPQARTVTMRLYDDGWRIE